MTTITIIFVAAACADGAAATAADSSAPSVDLVPPSALWLAIVASILAAGCLFVAGASLMAPPRRLRRCGSGRRRAGWCFGSRYHLAVFGSWLIAGLCIAIMMR